MRPERSNWFKEECMKKLITTVALVAALLLGSATAASQVTVAVGQLPGHFDPQNNNASTVSGIIINIFEYMVMKDEQGQFIPALATSWESVDPLTWRFTLREGVKWHDGVPFTAADVKFTFERVAKDATLVRHAYYKHIESVEIINDHEVVFHTSTPDPIFLSNLSRNGASVLPRHHWEAMGADVAAQKPIGTGPYVFSELRTDDRLILTANDDYWGGRPAYDTAVFRRITEGSTAVSELLTGGVDLVASVSRAEVTRFDGAAAAKVVPVIGNRINHLTFNTREGQITADQRIRAAVDYAVDDELLLEVLQDGAGAPVQARVSPGTFGSPLEYYDSYLYDVEVAKNLLAEAGYGPSKPAAITLMGSNGYADTADLVGAMLEEAGFVVEIKLFEPSVWSAKYSSTGDFTNVAFGAASDSSFDYGNSLIDNTCPNGVYYVQTGWCNEGYDALVNQANTEFDSEKRVALLRDATEILVAERPQYYMYASATFVGVSNAMEFRPRADSLIILATARPAAH